MPRFRANAAARQGGASFPGASGLMPAGASGLISAGAFASVLGASAFAFAFPLLASSAGWSFGTLGAAFTLYYLIRILCSPLAGALADRLGQRALLVPAALLGAVAPLFCLIWRAPATLLWAQCLLGACGAAIRPVSAAAVSRAGPPERLGRRFGSYNALINLAFFLGPLTAGALFFSRDPVPMILFLSLCMLLAALAFSRAPGKTAPDRAARTANQGLGVTDRPLFAAALVAIAGRTVQAAALAAFYPLILSRQTGGSVLFASVLFAAPALAACLALPLAGRLSDGRDALLFALGGMLAGSLALCGAGLAATPAGFLAAGLAMGAGASLSLPASMSLAARCGPDAGRLMGAAHAAAGAGFLMGPMFCALASERAGRLEAALLAAACAGVFACLPLCALYFERRLRYSRALSWGLAVLALAPGLLIWPGAGPAGTLRDAPDNLYRQTRAVMGTLATLTLEAADEAAAEQAAQAAFDRIAGLSADFDHRNPYGSVGRINQAAGKNPVRVSPEAFALIRDALTFARATDGIFDPAIGAVTVTPFYFLSPEAALRAKKELTDYRLVELDPDARTVFLPRSGMALDLGGLAKGAVMDAAVKVLKDHGVRSGVAEAGGDAVFFGDRTWTAGLRNPRGEGVFASIPVRNAALCGSGDYERYVDVDAAAGASGRRHHILDPRSMTPASKSAGVNVLARDAETADALATALFALGPGEGAAVLERFGQSAAALWISPDLEPAASPGFPALETPRRALTSPPGPRVSQDFRADSP